MFNLKSVVALILASALSTIATSLQSDRACYDVQGQVVPKFFPCNTDASISTCCSDNDLCLDNGLCLTFGWSRRYQVQGCTDRDWGAPCLNKLRTSVGVEGPGLRNNVWLCSEADKAHTYYCSGERDCCDDQNKWVRLENFFSIHVPREPHLRISYTPDWDSADTQWTKPSPTQPSPPARESSMNLSDRIAIGVGIPACLIALVLGLCQWLFPNPRIWGRRQAQANGPENQQLAEGQQLALGYGTLRPQAVMVERLQGSFGREPLPQPRAEITVELLESEDEWRESALEFV